MQSQRIVSGGYYPSRTHLQVTERSGARVQAICFRASVLAMMGLRYAEHVHELPAEPTRYKQGGNRDHGHQHRYLLADIRAATQPEVNGLERDDQQIDDHVN